MRLHAGRWGGNAAGFLRARPLACGCFAFALGVLAAKLALLDGSVFGAAAAMGAAGLLLFARAGRGMIAVALCFLLGGANCAARLAVPEMPAYGKWTAEGVICSDPAVYGGFARCYLRNVTVYTEEGGAQRLRGTLYCFLAADAESGLRYGDRVRVRGRSYELRGERNPGGYNERLTLGRGGAHVRMYVSEPAEKLADAAFSVRGLAYAVRHALAERMDALFGGASPVLRALLLGDSTEMPETWSQWMSRAGAAHLLAVSGLHVGLWFALVRRLTAPLHLRPAARLCLLAVLLTGYALLTGLRASVLRASLMLLCFESARASKRMNDPVTSLAAAGLLILLFRPLELFSAGFQMSFGAMAGLTLVYPALTRKAPDGLAGKICKSAALSLSAQLGALPAVAACFGRISPLGVFLNLLAVPMAQALLPIGALAVLLDAAFAPLGAIPAQAARGIAALLLRLAKLGSEAPLATARIPSLRWWTAIAFYAGLLTLSSAVRWNRRVRARSLAVLCAICVVCGAIFAEPACFYDQLDMGEGLSGVLHVNGKIYIYDCGRYTSELACTLRRYAGRVEAVAISHPNYDHYNGLWGLLEDGVKIGAVYVPPGALEFGGAEYASLMAAVAAQGIPIREAAAGDRFTADGLTVEALAPERGAQAGGANDLSLVLRVEAGGRTLLLTGDADGATEPQGAACDVLQVPHHGSRKACDEAALEGADPQIALISCGNSAYHPDADTVARLENAGAQVYVTRDSGRIRVIFDDDELKVEEFLP